MHKSSPPRETIKSRDVTKRRSRRITVSMRVGLSSADPAADQTITYANATNLNRFGATVALDRNIQLSSSLIVTNVRGTSTFVKVVADSGANQGIRRVGIEFLDTSVGAHFWGIHFPS